MVAKHWADNKKRYVLSVLAFIGLLITWFTFIMLVEEENTPMDMEIQQITFFIALFAVGTFYASQYFGELGSKPKGITFLLVPASAFEKLLCGLLYTVILFFVVFVAAYYLVDVLMVAIAKAVSGTVATGRPALANVFDVILLRFNHDSTINFLLFFFSVQSVFLLGSIYFEKYSFIKTIISGFVACFLLFCLLYFFNDKLLPGGNYPRGFLTSYRVHVDGVNDPYIQVPRWIGDVFRFLLMYAVAPFFWIVTYCRLKEKQV